MVGLARSCLLMADLFFENVRAKELAIELRRIR
jgi:hypothetical protein